MKDSIKQFKNGNFNEAINQLEEACSGPAPSYEAYLYLGASYVHVERFEDAVRAFISARNLRPDSPAIHYNLGQTYEALGLINEARECYEESIKIYPSYSPSKTALINLCLHNIDVQDNELKVAA